MFAICNDSTWYIVFFKKSIVAKTGLTTSSSDKRILKSILSGSIVGFICGFVGAGGGMMLLMVLTNILGYKMHVAVGTSVFIMAFTAFTGCISHFRIAGVPDITIPVFCVIFTFVWARIAAVIANKAKEKTLNRVVGVVLFVIGIVILITSR